MEKLLSELVKFGYKRQEAISCEGEFSRRGGIMDIWPLTFELPLRIDWQDNQIASLKSVDLPTGESFWEHTVAIILPNVKSKTSRLIHPPSPSTGKTMKGLRRIVLRSLGEGGHFEQESPLRNFLDIKTGDFVVHTRFGIGKFLGLEKIRIVDKYQAHMTIEYDRQEKLFVPVEQLHLVSKYLPLGLRRPQLNRLGTKEWLRTKQRVNRGVQQLAWQMLTSEAMRKAKTGFTFSVNTPWQAEFEKGFPFLETPGQAKALQEVKQDMASSKPMDRLLCGDVGYGKTEVAMRASFKAVMDNKQVAFLVPTTILAQQHYQNFLKRLESFPVRVEMLSRLVTKSKQREIIQDLAVGRVDIVIGTHRLLARDVRFRDLGLIIIDEEQRFGVRAKETLKQMRMSCDVLTLTATPIPRTLYMSLMQLKDLSIINTPPENRLPIKTFVLEYDEDLIRQAILNERKRKGQIYFVHNRILDIEKIRQRLVQLLPKDLRIGIVHGQMSVRQIEQTMKDFLNFQIDVLISTAIVESGLDIPNVNTLIVNNADEFGLADLHQLRGRVGRFNRPAFAYFLLPKKGVLTAEAKARLEALQQYSELGSGFKIAMEDLEIRGGGNLLGLEQHGYINAVGFDLYCQLLRQTVEAFRKFSK